MQSRLELTAALLNAKLLDPGKGGSWCKAEVDALVLLHHTIQTALTDPRVLQHVITK